MRELSITECCMGRLLQEARKQIESALLFTDKITCTLSLGIKRLPEEERVQIHFSEQAYYKMKELVYQCEKEVAWDGIVERDKENDRVFYIKDIIVYPQTVTASSVSTDDEKYAKWLMELDDETFQRRRFNGHSHVNMETSPSAVDLAYREQSVKNVKDFFIFGIFNKKGDCDFSVYDVENNLLYENEDIVLHFPLPDFSEWAKNEIEKNVMEKTHCGKDEKNRCERGKKEDEKRGKAAGRYGFDSYWEKYYGETEGSVQRE